MPGKKLIYLCCFFLYSFSNLNAQDVLRYALDAEYFNGFILKHKPTIGHLIKGHPNGFKITFNKQTRGEEKWHQFYNFPQIGASFIYLDYKNHDLGETLAIIPHYNFFITKNKASRSQFMYKIGLGLGYHTNKYDHVENNKNNVLSTDFTLGVNFEIGYRLLLSEQFQLKSSIALAHFSTGSLKQPNSGINVISTNFGVGYLIKKGTYTYHDLNEAPDKHDISYVAKLAGGAHEVTTIGAGIYPFFVLSGFVERKMSRKSILGIGIEWFYSDALRRDVKYDWRLEGKDKPDFNRIGITLSHELLVSKLSIIAQAGYYVYDPYGAFTPHYFRVGLRRYFNNSWFSSIAVKSHNARAEAIELAVGYKFR